MKSKKSNSLYNNHCHSELDSESRNACLPNRIRHDTVYLFSRPGRTPLAIFRLLTIISFLVLAFLANKFPYFKFDLQNSQWLQSFHQPLISGTMNVVSELGDDFHLQIIVGLAVLILFKVGLKMEAFKTASFTFGSYLIGSLSKYLVNRPRPDSSLVFIQEALVDKSFPSLHVLTFTVFFGYLLFLSLTRLKILWLRNFIAITSSFLILTIGISRIYLGAHWLSDVVGGYLMGALFISFLVNHAKR